MYTSRVILITVDREHTQIMLNWTFDVYPHSTHMYKLLKKKRKQHWNRNDPHPRTHIDWPVTQQSMVGLRIIVHVVDKFIYSAYIEAHSSAITYDINRNKSQNWCEVTLTLNTYQSPYKRFTFHSYRSLLSNIFKTQIIYSIPHFSMNISNFVVG